MGNAADNIPIGFFKHLENALASISYTYVKEKTKFIIISKATKAFSYVIFINIQIASHLYT